MLDRSNLLALIKTVATATPSGNYSFGSESFSYNDLQTTLRNELNEMVGSEDLWEQNKRKVFSLVAEVLDEVVPVQLENAYGRFAEIKQYAQGEKPIFKRKLGRTRAKQFITRVGLAGRYEVFELSEEAFEVRTSAIGGAARIGFEEFLDGRVDFAELTAIVMEGMNELIYKEIAKAMIDAIDQLPSVNQVSSNDFNEKGMDFLVNNASMYGSPTIFCTREFAVKMLPNNTDWVSNEMKNQRWANGYLANYKGTPVVILPQSFEDATNGKKVVDPAYAWVMPNDGNKPVKVAFEGVTHIREVNDNDDWSRDIQVYRKVGVSVMMNNGIQVYKDTSLKLDNTKPTI